MSNQHAELGISLRQSRSIAALQGIWYFLRNEITFNSLNLDLADLEDNIVKHLLNNLNDLFVKGEYIGTYTINSESYYIFKLC